MLNQAWHTTSTEYPITSHSGYMRHRRKKTHAHACAPTHKRVKHHHLETIYWTFATRYQLNTELSILCLHPNSRDRLHFITLRWGNVTGLGKAHAVLEVILAFGLRIICEKNESASKKCPMALALLAGTPEEKTSTEEWEETAHSTRAEMCSHEWRKKKKLKEKWWTWNEY